MTSFHTNQSLWSWLSPGLWNSTLLFVSKATSAFRPLFFPRVKRKITRVFYWKIFVQQNTLMTFCFTTKYCSLLLEICYWNHFSNLFSVCSIIYLVNLCNYPLNEHVWKVSFDFFFSNWILLNIFDLVVCDINKHCHYYFFLMWFTSPALLIT